MPTNTPAPGRDNTAETAATTPLGRGWKRWVRWAIVLATLVAALALGAWWFLLVQIVPKIDQWREPLAKQASSTLGVPVRIGQATGRAQGWWPEVSLRDVALLDAHGREALKLPSITARLSPATLWPTSLWRREVHVDRLVLERPQLEIRRDRQGRLHVAGLTVDPAQAQGGDNAALDWLLDQEMIHIQQGAIRWHDEMRSAPPLQLTAVDLTLRNRPGLARRVHDWTLAATPPSTFGQRFTVRAHLTQPLWARSVDPDEAPAWWARWLGGPTRSSEWRNWSGDIQLALPHVDVQSLRRHASLPFEIQGGRGRLALALSLRKGQPRELTLDADVQAVSLRLAPELQPLAFRQVAGQVKALHQPTRTELSWQALRFTTDDGLVWPSSRATLQWQHPAAKTAPGQPPVLLPELQGQAWERTLEGRFETDHLDLALLARLADRVPLSTELRRQLARLAPVGIGRQLTLSWKGPASAPRSYSARGTLEGLSWQAGDDHPGVAGAQLRFKATERGGEATVAIKDGWAEFPGAFEEPRIPLQSLQANLNWRLTPPTRQGRASGIALSIRQARFANEDAQGELRADWTTGPGEGVGEAGRFPGVLDLSGRLTRAQGTRVWRYLPAAIHADARHYVRDAVKAGVGENVAFEVRGDLWKFPFKDDQGGLFRITVPVRGATLDYVPGSKPPAGAAASAPYWPVFTNLDGLLVFHGHEMRIENATAALGELGTGGFALRKVSGRIQDLAHDDPVLTMEGEGSGPLNDLLRYVAVSPVGEWTGQMLADAQGSGRGTMSLALSIPLNKVEAATVKGEVVLDERDNAGLRLGPQVPPMQTVRGRVQFTQDSLKVAGKARVWGQEVVINGSRDAQGVPRFVASGMLSAEGLRTATEWPVAARLARHMTGQTPVSVTVALNRVKGANGAGAFNARPELQIGSTLQGLQLDLPAPFTKPAAAAWPLKIVHRGDDTQGKRDALQVELSGPLSIKADYRSKLNDRGPPTVTGTVSISQGNTASVPPLPAEGVVARAALPGLDLDAWQNVIAGLTPEPPAAGSAAPGAAESTSVGTGLAEAYMPDTMSIRTSALTWRQRTLRDVSVTLAHPAPAVWRAQIDSPQLAGQIEVRPDLPQPGAKGEPASRVVARLSRLQIPEAEAEAFEEQAARQMLASTDPVSVPALDIIIEQFDWRGRPLGRLEVEAINRVNAAPGQTPLPEWRLTKFRLGNPDAQLSATGNWAALGALQSTPKGSAPRHRAAFTFSLDLANSGNLLTRLGMPQTLRGGKGKMTGQVSWLGSPLEPHAASLNGDVTVSINEGQFLKAEPGVAKLLGVLSLQSLPRRLILDFRDVFQSGFAFDRIEGDVSIAQGVASTRNLRMRGVQAVVLMEGMADLARETQNLRVFVVPEINAGTASLAYAAINPAIGLGTFIAQVLLRKTVVEASTREFTITGSWSDPQVERVQRSSVPAAAGGASAPAARPKPPQAAQPSARDDNTP